MKLTDRDARFATQDGRVGTGVTWECLACGERHWIPFENPIDGGARVYPQGGWLRTGETLETLTLTPSILFHAGHGCPGWHGFITNGQLVTCP